MLTALKHKLNWTHLFFALALAMYAFVLARPIDLTTQDIGRHLANGREIFAGRWEVLYQNHYSYTLPEKKMVNHHWLFGAFNYLIYLNFGFTGVQLIHIAIMLVGAALLLNLIRKNSSSFISWGIGLAAILFLSLRVEVRPEGLGLLFFINTLWQLDLIQQNKSIKQSQILILLLQQLVWVNWHISFAFGIGLPVLFWACSAIFHSPNLGRKTNKRLFIAIAGLTIISLINPNFIRGLLQPLTIFMDYGYSIAENQTLLFLWRVIKMPYIFSYLLVLIPTLFLYIYKGRSLNLFETLKLIIGLGLGFMALRHIPLFAALSFSVLAQLIHLSWIDLKKNIEIQIEPIHKLLSTSLLYGTVLLLLLSGNLIVDAKISNRYLGQPPQQAAAAQYFKSNSLPTPIFNNYDLGSYLIFYLSPEVRVFTDNRPEAYGRKFFQQIYIPMQENPQVWERQMEQHQFKTIIFGVRDITNWGIDFKRRIKKDPSWKEVYRDSKIVIYTLKSQEAAQN